MDILQKTIWITGASSGIGKHLAIEYAKKKSKLILSSRNIEKLELLAKYLKEKYNCDADVIPFDLTNENSIRLAVEKANANHTKIDILINNGGITQRSLIIETPVEIDRQIFETNYFGTICLTKAVLPWMISAGGGQIAVISSIVGKYGFPLRSAYSASKHALHGFFETVGLELYNKNIKPTIICPGRIVTDISINAITKDGGKYGKMDEGQASGVPVAKCARKIVKAIQRKRNYVFIGGSELVLLFLRKYIPVLFFKLARNVKPT